MKAPFPDGSAGGFHQFRVNVIRELGKNNRNVGGDLRSFTGAYAKGTLALPAFYQAFMDKPGQGLPYRRPGTRKEPGQFRFRWQFFPHRYGIGGKLLFKPIINLIRL